MQGSKIEKTSLTIFRKAKSFYKCEERYDEAEKETKEGKRSWMGGLF